MNNTVDVSGNSISNWIKVLLLVFLVACYINSQQDINDNATKLRTAVQQTPPNNSQRATFNTTSCVWIHFTNYGRAGNRLWQIQQVDKVLSHCSGVATSLADVNRDPTVAFPSIALATTATKSTNDYTDILEAAARHCREVHYTWGFHNEATRNCSPQPMYELVHSWSTADDAGEGINSVPDLPALLPQTFIEIDAWKYIFDLNTMVMYFRGGDILQINAHSGYSQAPCSLFIESWKFVGPERVMLVYDNLTTIHPCISVVRGHIPSQKLVEAPCQSAGCHMALVGRAPYVVISGVTTFASAATSLFPRQRRVTFEYFCGSDPQNRGNTLAICVKGSNTGLVPWNYTKETEKIMYETKSEIVLGRYDKEKVQAFLKEL